MKQLKYLKLFEGFESIKLTKTLGYINKESRDRFVDYLKRLCKKSEFPLSQLNDEMFQYLPYSKALKVKVETENVPCKATSSSVFDRQYAISGEKCEGGRIKRMWGSRQRVVECPNCSGTGIEPTKENLKVVKFWFTKDGQLVTTTGCDGTQKKPSISRSISGYKIVDTINADSRGWQDKIRELKHLTNIILKTSSESEPIQAVLFVDPPGSRSEYFCIQNSKQGGEPSGREWRNYGRFSWNISGGDFWTISVLEPGEQENDKEDEIDPLTYNYPLSFGWSGISLDKYRDVEQYIKDAHFALVFDYDKVKNGDFKKVSQIKSEREIIKSGSKLTIKDEDVRRENIERYMKKIAERSDLISDITNVKSVVNRMIGGQYALFIITSRSSFENNFTRIISRYLEILRYQKSEMSQQDLNYYINSLKDTIKNNYETSSSDISDIRKAMKYCRESIIKNGTQNEYLDLLNELEEVSKLINQKIVSLPFDCIEDLEIVKSKTATIRNLFNSDTYGLSNLRYFLDSALNGREDRSYRYLTDEWRLQGDNLEETKKGLETVKKIISRL